MGERGDRGDFTANHGSWWPSKAYDAALEEVAALKEAVSKPKSSVQESDDLRPVRKALKGLEVEIDATRHLIEVLEERLNPVLGFAKAEKFADDDPSDANGSPLANRLDFHIGSLELANSQLRSILDRLEL